MDQIFIQGLQAYGVIGVYEWERQAPQLIIIDVVVETDIHPTARDDALGVDNLDYGLLAKSLRRFVEENSPHTLERLAEDLAAVCLEHPGVQRVRLRLEKPGAISFAKSAGIEITRSVEA